MLAVYRDAPAVIVADEDTVWGDLDTPFVVIMGSLSDEPDDHKVEDGRDVLISVRVIDTADGSTLRVQQIAERVRLLLHRRPDGLLPGAWLASVSGPSVAATDPSLLGRQLDVRVQATFDPGSLEFLDEFADVLTDTPES